jgi:hypothetical protein
VKFKREVLIEKAKARRARHIAIVEQRNEQEAQRAEEFVRKHLQERDLRPLINLLRRAHDNNTPLTKKSFDEARIKGVNTDGWSSRATLQSPIMIGVDGPKVEKPDTRRIDAFIQFLEAATDDEVSSAALVQHGFKDFPGLT